VLNQFQQVRLGGTQAFSQPFALICFHSIKRRVDAPHGRVNVVNVIDKAYEFPGSCHDELSPEPSRWYAPIDIGRPKGKFFIFNCGVN
jgi:hypothetical protein